ncbi:transketolase [Candidatus Manganitrophus noduliformans]|uniref:Transketolase n=1 Tax=Candidatus Manganitrophus noduliformans TaxID=2606439 RepID=A0A7X6DN62_9BACT|nr:transketolase [Candidatus Manganitrophus noduliformans]NKE70259.1 transketolase [Candidatus Manganitrophus noduliformans]
MNRTDHDLDPLCVNTLRFLAADAVQKANSGHPGTPMGLAPLGYLLWTRFLKHNPRNPQWPDRDRFVLSAGHASMLLYSLLHLTGYDLPLEEIRRFRQWGSKTPGHPEYGHTPGVETTTGPLGQGFANGVGMAMAERFLAARFNRPGYDIVDHNTYVIAGDGDMMEGITSEAASLAGNLRLGKLICFYDDNHITIEGSTDLAFCENVKKRFEAYCWHVVAVHDDGNDLDAISEAIRSAQAETDRPSLIIVRTHIGYGSPHKQDTAQAHGEPLGEEEVARTKQNLGWPPAPDFYIPDAALRHYRKGVEKGQRLEADWQRRFAAYAAEYPDLAEGWRRVMNGTLPEEWDAEIKKYRPKGPMATRQASGEVLNRVAPALPTLIGGSADLAPSTNTYLKGMGDFLADQDGGRNIHFGVREHGMGGILNGMALHRGVIPYGGTFLIFSDYMKPSIRLAALMNLPVIYVFTHDSIGLGEDGPTHQPIEQLAGLRAIPNLTVIRPADATETEAAWRLAIERRGGPVALVLTRQKLPLLDRSRYAPAGLVEKGAYLLTETQGRPAELILIATGSEVHLALEAAQKLASQGMAVRVVSMPSWELFEKQPVEYRNAVLPPEITARVSIEAASTFGWRRYVGLKGDAIGRDDFGASAPGEVVLREFGFTAENVMTRVLKLLKNRSQAIREKEQRS